jgi:Fe2+ transport system protein FeoA
MRFFGHHRRFHRNRRGFFVRFFEHHHTSHQKSSAQDSVSLRALCELPVGGHGIIRQLHGGRQFCARIAAPGFTIGAEVVIIKNFGRGPIIAAVRDTQVALGRFEADRILVKAVQGSSDE